ncbi:MULTISPECIES: TonB-dependent receptor [Caulobacter]|jgi:iron complex outermembrane receptor protein|uniref:Outer membrane receptor protein n=2 Tax=Bacteria TaxID=2 RepID=R0CVU8_CAUVI|nr:MULTISPECIES: TonB-dependent receptor [Caulobacter]ENZ80636.1 outer membrane receptor protein [Caulobacter vibrioides OR37]MBQ1559722.1 TonB-dependent receptor [Caulobacter sp.]
MRNVHLLGVSALALAIASPAFAQQKAADNNSIEEIVVTATKREQTLQDVPISVAVTGQQTIERAQVKDLIDLQSVVPSLKVSQFNATGQTNFVIRGFGNGNGNDGIESSVGVFIDGVYRSRSAAALDDLPEVERIEVLRGPQSTLFGKNVSAGAISIVTKKPQFETGGKVEATMGNYNQKQIKGTFTTPLSDTLAIRLSGSLNKRDGFFTNVITGNDVNTRDRWSVRGDVLWEPTDKTSVRIIADYNKIKETCCAVAQIYNGPATQAIGAVLGKQIGNPNDIFSYNVVFNTDPSNDLSGKGVSGQIDHDFGFAKLTSITAYRNQKNASFQDIDFSGADISNNRTANNIKTFTQEVRLASNSDGPLNWLIGGFYEHEKLDTGRTITYGKDIRSYADVLSGAVPATLLGALPPTLRPALTGKSNLYALEFLQSLATPTLVKPGSTYFQAGQGLNDYYSMTQRSYSIFGQADYKVTDKLTITGGLAYLSDDKKASSNVVMNDPFSALNLAAVPQFQAIGLPGNLYQALGALQFFYANTTNHAPVNFPNATESGELKGDKVTYAIRAAYDFGHHINAYVSYSTGWKAGAYNLSSDSRPPNANGVGRTAQPENVDVYELGVKTSFTGGYANVAVFKQSIKGFQSNAYTGLGYSLVNAGEESVKGFEFDSAWRPISWLNLTAAATYLDPVYDSFTGAACVNYDTARCPVNPATGLRPNFRNLTGDTPAGIPKWTVSGSATINHDFGNDYSGYARVEYDYVSKTQLTETVPPNLNSYSQNVVNASIGVTNRANQIDIMFWARNLTKDKYLISAFPTVAQDGSYSGYPSQPRTYGVTVRKSF